MDTLTDMAGRYRTGQPQTACPDCFAHPWLRDFVKTQPARHGTCPNCGRRDQPLVPVSVLYDPFENLLSSYHRAEGPPLERGIPIVELIQRDWDVFSERLLERGGEGRLLEAIMHSGWDDDSGEGPLGALDCYLPHAWSHDTLEEIWDQFASEVSSDPSRLLTFRGAGFDEFLMREDLIGRRTVRVPQGAVLWRARLGFDRSGPKPKPYAGPDIGTPPPDKATAGRANAQGKTVLYCADQRDTAVAEVRPALGEYVSVAAIVARTDLEILDLVTEPEWPNPFTDEAVRHWVEVAQLLSAFAHQLRKPLRSRDDLTDYIPSQKLAEFIERNGVVGIRYPSAMALGGTNVVLFDPSIAEVGPSSLVEIVKARVEYREVP